MANAWALSALWVGLALVATLLAIWFKVSTALSEIVVGTVAQLIIGVIFGPVVCWAIPSGSRFSPAREPSCSRSWPARNSIL